MDSERVAGGMPSTHPHRPGPWAQESIAAAFFLLRRRLRLTGKATVRPTPLELGTCWAPVSLWCLSVI